MKAITPYKRNFKAERERLRMGSITRTLDVLRKQLQLSLKVELKLPKIETLKLAKNYINVLLVILSGNNLTKDEFITLLTVDLRQNTINILRKLNYEN